MRVGIVCGAGTSIPVGKPSTASLTSTVLAGVNYRRHTCGNYEFDDRVREDFESQEVYVPRVTALLQILKDEVDGFFHCGRHSLSNEAEFYKTFGRHQTNYEDLYFCARQLSDSDHFEYENPAVQALYEKLLKMPAVLKILQHKPGELHENWELTPLLNEVCTYIRDVVENELWKTPNRLWALSFLLSASRDGSLSKIDIYTLNHDTILEELFRSFGVPYSDGFCDHRGNVLHWNRNDLSHSNAKVRIFKLHGSVDWYSFPSPGPVWQSQCVGKSLDRDPYHARNELGERHELWHVRGPLMLMGTFNKLLEYNYGIFAELQVMFHQNLLTTDYLVVCGYSFGDKVINARLLDWLCSSESHRLAVVDPNASRMEELARGAIRRKWERLIGDEKVIPFVKGIEQADWYSVKNCLLRDKGT
ncbi:MAG: SIR2 family protein [Candidatus Hydrogenedentes bacterium]|nr:SIR2 family protein [Candidatus Hydrogenedentota bacterium]